MVKVSYIVTSKFDMKDLGEVIVILGIKFTILGPTLNYPNLITPTKC